MEQKLLLTFLHYQRYLGLTDLDYSETGRGYWLNATWCSYGIQLLVAGTFFSALVAALSEPLYYIETKSSTGNIFDNAVMMTASVTQLLANLWFRSQQQTQVALLQRLSRVKEQLQVDTEALSSPRWMFRLWVATWFFYGYMVGDYAASFWLTTPKLSHALTLLGFCLRIMSANFQFTCYSGMVCVLQRLLSVQAEGLKILLAASPISLEAVGRSLRIHDEILMLCQKELVQVYGGVLLFLFLYQVMQCVLIFYVSTLEGTFYLEVMLTMSGWLSPILLYLILPLMVNDVSNQVSPSCTLSL
ncbi:blast:Gustatory and pheromone receptor 39a%2C isoform B [Drosophila guanche]|uniref:Gustatory receptor n=1 Tax=Drosophila guanche TaxID=7266 RepID=A0A3B0KQ62_DROGU|nr:blast:Gustatory and pheromone receptor 39a%2C isoform B [Drosophila guanche]